jgi:ubiquinone/menaquinone biosynthesis C-methylase UbiE
MIEKGLARIGRKNFPLEKLDVIIADASRMPFRDKVFRHTYSFSLLNKALWEKIWTEITRVTQKTILFTFITDEDKESIPSECSYPRIKVGKEVLCIYQYTNRGLDERKACNGGNFVGRTNKE